MKKCENCKWCEYNILLNKYKKMNFLEKIWFNLFDSYGKVKLDCSKTNPHCLCPDVYYISIIDFKKHKTFCSLARTYSTPNFHLCEENGKYFEKNT